MSSKFTYVTAEVDHITLFRVIEGLGSLRGANCLVLDDRKGLGNHCVVTVVVCR
jgi:hypothetical protein